MAELKVSLGAKDLRNPGAKRRRREAERRYGQLAARAEAALRVALQQAADAVDRLTPDLIAYLIGEWQGSALDLDDEARWTHRPLARKIEAQERLREIITEDLNEALASRGLGNLEGIHDLWSTSAITHAALHGYNVDAETAGFSEYVRAIHDAQIDAWQIMLRRNLGERVPAPPISPRPQRIGRETSSLRVVDELIEAYRAAKWEGWSQSTRMAIEPVFRLLRDSLGNRPVQKVTRKEARDVMDLVKALPSGLGRKQELKGMSVPEAVERGKALGLPPIVPGTANKGYMVHLSAIFNFARQEQWAPDQSVRGA